MQLAQLVGEAVLTFYRVRDSSMGWATDRMHQERRGLRNHLLSNGFNQHLMPKPPRRMRHLPCSSLKMIPVLGSITWLPQIRLIYESGQIFFFLVCSFCSRWIRTYRRGNTCRPAPFVYSAKMGSSVIDRGIVLKSIIIGRVCLILLKNKLGLNLPVRKQFHEKKGGPIDHSHL